MNPMESLDTGSSACRVSRVCSPWHTEHLVSIAVSVSGEVKLSNMSAAALRARGHQCVLEETRERNVVELVVSGEVVFSCDIKQLQFG